VPSLAIVRASREPRAFLDGRLDERPAGALEREQAERATEDVSRNEVGVFRERGVDGR
jgi:hypothetical protein